jgi:hypothetical protein
MMFWGADVQSQGTQHHRCIHRDQRFWVLFRTAFRCCKSTSPNLYQANKSFRANNLLGHVSRIKTVHIRNEIDRAISSLRLCANGRLRLPNRHRNAEYQHWGVGPAAYSGVTDRSDHGMLVSGAEAQGVGER